MDGFNVGLIVVVILSIVAYIAQNIMVKKLWQTKGINLSSNRIILGMAGLGFFILCVFIYGKSLGMSLGSVMGDLGTIGWVIAIITIACFAYVLIRNLRGAGAGTGIVLTVLQTLSGVLSVADRAGHVCSRNTEAHLCHAKYQNQNTAQSL